LQHYFHLNRLLPALGFMQVGLDNVTSAICKSQLQFGLQRTEFIWFRGISVY